MTMKADIRVMDLQGKSIPGWPVNHQKPGEWHGTDSPSQFSKGINPAHTFVLGI